MPSISQSITVHSHDIFLPFGMPLAWSRDLQLYWTEQYLLYAYLLGNSRARVIFGSAYAFEFLRDRSEHLMRRPLWRRWRQLVVPAQHRAARSEFETGHARLSAQPQTPPPCAIRDRAPLITVRQRRTGAPARLLGDGAPLSRDRERRAHLRARVAACCCHLRARPAEMLQSAPTALADAVEQLHRRYLPRSAVIDVDRQPRSSTCRPATSRSSWRAR